MVSRVEFVLFKKNDSNRDNKEGYTRKIMKKIILTCTLPTIVKEQFMRLYIKFKLQSL
jgi:hypothetical protein